MSVAEQLKILHDQIGNRPVRLVAVTKYTTLEKMVEAYDAGIQDLGESRVLDALEKKSQLPADMVARVRWHLIGHLQTNKVNKTVGQFDWIHSVDSPRLAQKISEANQSQGLIQPVLLQVNIAGETQKHGYDPEKLKQDFSTLMDLKGIRIDGLMTMAPNTEDTEVIRGTFQGLKNLRDELSGSYAIDLPELSMGMTHDYLHALELGATMIRIGSFLFQTNKG